MKVTNISIFPLFFAWELVIYSYIYFQRKKYDKKCNETQ